MVKDKIQIYAIFCVVERGKGRAVIDAAKKSGASGGTIFYGRGTGESEAKRFLDMDIENSKEGILVLCKDSEKKNIIEAMTEEGQLKTPGKGILFSFKAEDVVGLRYRDTGYDFSQDLF